MLTRAMDHCDDMVMEHCDDKISEQLRVRSGMGKDGCQFLLEVITLSESQMKGPDPIFSHPA